MLYLWCAQKKNLHPLMPWNLNNEMPGITLDVWGPAAWNTLHVFAHTMPHRLSRDQQAELRAFLLAFASYLPCPRCRHHFDIFLRERIYDDAALATREAVVRLLNDGHNDVNARTGRRVFTLREHYDVYSREAALFQRRRGMQRTAGIAIALALSVCAAIRLRRPECSHKKIR